MDFATDLIRRMKEEEDKKTKQEADQRAIQRLQDTKDREESMLKGRKFGEELFDLSPEQLEVNKQILDKYKQYSEGMTPEELQAYRENAANQRASDYATGARQLQVQMGAMGGRGGALSGQLGNMKALQAQQGLQNERDLFLQNVGMKRTGLDQYGNALYAQRKEDLARKSGIGGMSLSYGSLTAADQAKKAQEEAAIKQAEAMRLIANQDSCGVTSWICSEAIKRMDFGLSDKKLIVKLREYLEFRNSEGYKVYRKICKELVNKMYAANFDWTENTNSMKDILKLIKENKMEDAYLLYQGKLLSYINRFWKDINEADLIILHGKSLQEVEGGAHAG